MEPEKRSRLEDERDAAGTQANPDRDERDSYRFRLGSFVEKLALLVVAFMLTTVVGTYLSNQFRSESTRAELEIAAMQSDINRLIQVFEAISQLMDKRLFRTSRLHDVFTGDAPDQEQPRLVDYRTALIEWNDNVNRYRALFAMHFQPDDSDLTCGTSFEDIMAAFAKTHIELQKLISRKKDGDPDKVASLLRDLNNCVYDLDTFMLTRINARRAAYENRISKRGSAWWLPAW